MKKEDKIEEPEESKIEEPEESKKEENEESKNEGFESLDHYLTRKVEGVDVNDIIEGGYGQKEEDGSRKLLKGFKLANVKIHFLSDELEKLYPKSKYHDLFDIGYFSILSARCIKEDINVLFKKGAQCHIETGDNLVPLKKEQRVAYREKLVERCQAANWVEMKNPPFKHHVFWQVDKEETEASKSTVASTIDDDFSLADLEL